MGISLHLAVMWSVIPSYDTFVLFYDGVTVFLEVSVVVDVEEVTVW